MFPPKTVSVLLVVAIAARSTIHAQQTPGLIAGFRARTEVDTFLQRDLIQVMFDTIVEDETCASFDLGENFYNDQDPEKGAYFRSIPTYKATISDEYNEFIQYTGDINFHLSWVDAAFARSKTEFKRGNANFGKAFGDRGNEGNDLEGAKPDGNCVGYKETVTNAILIFNFIEAMQLMQRSIDILSESITAGNTCLFATSKEKACNDAVTAWDASVAIFVGSLEGRGGNQSQDGSYGKSVYALSDKQCDDFSTCGNRGNRKNKEETAFINNKILTLYSGGAQAAASGLLQEMVQYKRKISAKMIVPFVQGVFQYAYRLGQGSRSDKDVAKAGTLALGALPKLWSCSQRGAKKAESELKIGGENAGKKPINFDKVRLAFECNYRCLGITCAEVGSLFDEDGNLLFAACNDVDNSSDKISVANKTKMRGERKQKCQKFTGKPGIVDRDDYAYVVRPYNSGNHDSSPGKRSS